MSTNHHSSSSNPLVPSRQCAAYADLLPVLDEPETEASAAEEVRTHLATCAYCQDRLRQYTQLDATIARAVGVDATPRKRTEDIMRDILHENTTQAETTPIAASAPTPITYDPAQPRGPQLNHLPHGSRRRWSGIASLAAVLAVALLAAILFAGQGHGGPGAKATPAPDWGGPGSQTRLSGISMVSATEGWAVGSAFPSNGTNGNQARPLLLHYKDGVWTSIRLSIPGQLSDVSMISASDGWAMGTYGLILHYDGTAWRQVASPTRGGFARVQMLSATDGWAVDNTFAKGALFHYDGHAWTAYPLPTTVGDGGGPSIGAVSLTDISMLSPTDGWASGTVSTAGPGTPTISNSSAAPAPTTPIMLQYHAGTWTIEYVHALPATISSHQTASIESISASATDDVWAVGALTSFLPGQPIVRTMLLLHFTGGGWQRVPDPLAGTNYHATDFLQIAMRAPDDGWITASQGAASTAPVALHYDGTHWSVVALPDIPHSSTWYLTGLTYSPAGDLWAIGARLSDATTGEPDGHGGFTPTITPLMLHEQHGTWSVVMR